MARHNPHLLYPAVLAACLAGMTLSCAEQKPPKAQPPPPLPQAEVTPQPPPEAPPPTAATPAPAPAPRPPEGPTISAEPVIIERGGVEASDASAEAPPTLAEAAQAERERRRSAPQPVAVVHNKNLAQYAAGGKLTIAAPESDNDSAAEAEQQQQLAAEEAHWRARVLEVRKRWRDAVDQIHALDQRIAELRTRFYAEDDPYVRDGRIKPEWDRALELLDDARRSAYEAERELDLVIEEGQEAGALPGWLREGIELEPTDRPYRVTAPEDNSDGSLIGEPDVIDEDDDGGGG